MQKNIKNKFVSHMYCITFVFKCQVFLVEKKETKKMPFGIFFKTYARTTP